MDEQAQALAELKALMKVPGALMITTDELIDDLKHHEALPDEHRNSDSRAASIVRKRLPPRPDADPDALKRHASFVRIPVASLEGPDDEGFVTVRAEDGSWRRGKPAAVLKRLREGREG